VIGVREERIERDLKALVAYLNNVERRLAFVAS
jgi:hypothetical protein